MRELPLFRPLSLLLLLVTGVWITSATSDLEERGLLVKARELNPFQKLWRPSFSGNENECDDENDCDEGEDDGARWRKGSVYGLQKRPAKRLSIRGMTPFPAWLTDITGLRAWPVGSPPYIEQSEIKLYDLPYVPFRELGNCSGVDISYCSFDCYRCTTPDDIFTCPLLSQTFDDGPGPATPKLLDNLPGKTTFFTQGVNVVRFPEIFRQQHYQGHLLASHTWNHEHLASLSNENVAAQIQWSIWAMNATAGIIPKYFRPPYGASDNRIRAISRQFGLTSVFWDRDTFDWMVNDRKKSAEKVYDDVLQWKRELPQGLILEHDSTIDVVNVGIQVAKILDADHPMTVADCVNAQWYQNIPRK